MIDNREKLRQIVDSQLDKLLLLSKRAAPLAANEVKSLTELARLIEGAASLDVIKETNELAKLSHDELILIKAHREKIKDDSRA